MSEARLRALAVHLKKWEAFPFALGSTDCIAFTTDWIDSQRGTSLTLQVEHEYRTLSFAEVRVYAEPGRLRGAIIDVLGAPCGELDAQLGDVVLYDNFEGKETLGVAGESMVYGPGITGLGALALHGRARAVWRLERIG